MISFGSRFAFHLIFASLVPVIAIAQQTPDLSSSGLRASLQSPPAPSRTASTLTPEMRGDIYMARKMYREAIDMYRRCPESALIENKIGIAFHQMLQFPLAKKSYERAIKLNPSYGEAINNLGTVYYAERSYKKAITYYKRSLKYSGPKASVYANLGAAYFARRDYKRSSEYYEQALAIDPDVLEHRNTFGTIMQERTVSELALFHLYLAKTYAKGGNNARALIYLRKALEEGLKDRKKLPDVPEFSLLKNDPAFQQLLAENPKPL
jgi:tetratricopeptide (TPR) repeat protein